MKGLWVIVARLRYPQRACCRLECEAQKQAAVIARVNLRTSTHCRAPHQKLHRH